MFSLILRVCVSEMIEYHKAKHTKLTIFLHSATANLFLSIHVDIYCGGPDPCVARCKFLSRIEDEVYCMVSFTGPDGVTHTSVSTERGRAGESVTVELMLSNGLPLPPLTVYSYQATTVDINRNISCSRVNSAFETGYYDYGKFKVNKKIINNKIHIEF